MDEDLEIVLSKLQTANRVMEDLIDMSMSDDKMSDDEKEILFSINSNLAKYAKTIIQSISDGSISIEENLEIKKMEKKILNDAQIVANSDQKITTEEKMLIDELIEAIESISNM